MLKNKYYKNIEMNNKKRPAVSDTTLTRRYSRRISANNNAEPIASIDDCVDEILLSIASYLTSCELLKLALTCKRFGARSTVSAKEDDKQQDDISETNAVLQNGSRAFARPSSNGTIVLPQHFRDREVIFMEGVIIDHSHITESYRVEFQNHKLNLNGNNKQWIDQTQVVSIEDMTKRVEQSLRFCVKRDGDTNTISISHYIMIDKRWDIGSEFVESIATSMIERVDSSLQNKGWSLMEEAALQNSLNFLSMKDGGCLMWREGESWMGIYNQFVQELNLLLEEEYDMQDYELQEQNGYWQRLMDRFGSQKYSTLLDNSIEHSNMLEKVLAPYQRSQSRRTVCSRFFQHYNTSSPLRSGTLFEGDESSSGNLDKCHMRGVGMLIGLFENGVNGIYHDIGKRIQIVLFLACLHSLHVTGPFIIISPLSLIPQWVQVFKQYTDLPISCLTSKEERNQIVQGRLDPLLYGPSGEKSADFPVIITSYEVAAKYIIFDKYKYMIIDESSGFERYRCALLSEFRDMEADYQLFATASPVDCDVQVLEKLAFTRFVFPTCFDSDDVYPLAKYLKECDEEKRQQIVNKVRAIVKPCIISCGNNGEWPRIDTQNESDMPIVEWRAN